MDIVEQLRRDEGEVLRVYLDSEGIRTAGVGHNLESHGINWPVGTEITKQQSADWLKEDIRTSETQLHSFLPWTDGLDEVRRGVLLNMAFNMGIHSLLGFKNTLRAIHDGEYGKAAGGMLKSRWAEQVGARASRLARQMFTGEWQ